MKPSDPTVLRLRAHLASVTRRYPDAWSQLAGFRRDKKALGGWPDWCDVPLSAAYAIVTAGTDRQPSNTDASVVGGLGTWRLTQGVYRFDADLLEALWTTPIERVPAELLYRLPEWCVYLETPGRQFSNARMHGCFVWLEWDVNARRTELRTIIDTGDMLYPLILHLLPGGTLEACLDAAMGESLRNMPTDRNMPAGLWEAARDIMRQVWPGIIALTLYLCSDEPDMTNSAGTAATPRPPTRRKDGTIIPASAPVEWVIGSRLGRQLRQARSQQHQGGEHAAPRPHVRRAHFHHYWTGPKAAGQTLSLRWLHPVLVGAGDVPVTIRSVE